jgi:hypothetical protein
MWYTPMPETDDRQIRLLRSWQEEDSLVLNF